MIRKLLKHMAGENFTENNAKLAGVNFGIILAMFLFSGIMLFFLPEEIPVLHNGTDNYLVPSTVGVWLLPVVASIINLSFIKQKRLSKINSMIFAVFLFLMIVYYISLATPQ